MFRGMQTLYVIRVKLEICTSRINEFIISWKHFSLVIGENARSEKSS